MNSVATRPGLDNVAARTADNWSGGLTKVAGSAAVLFKSSHLFSVVFRRPVRGHRTSTQPPNVSVRNGRASSILLVHHRVTR